jgi:3-oxoacyl-(acyl-carrier-protein) synthase
MKKNRVVITGMGLVSPIGNNLELFWNNLLAGKSGISFNQELAELGLKCIVAGVPNISESENRLIEEYNAKRFSSSIHYALLASIQACKQANIPVSNKFDTEANYNLGVIIGSLASSSDIINTFIEDYYQKSRIHKFRMSIAETIMNSGISTFISGITGAGNCVLSTSNACASSTEAIVLAYERIKNGQSNQIIAGGTEATSIPTWGLYDAMRVIGSDSNNEPEYSSRPLNEIVNGFIPAAGAGVLVLESLESAINRNANIYAEIIGGQINSGGQRNGGTMSAPNSEAVVKCITDTLQMAEMSENEIDYINGHLTSTMADVLEINNYVKALNLQGTDFPFINSIKGMTGHCIGAAGAIETIAAVLQMNNNMIHANKNCMPIHPEITKVIDTSRIPIENTKLQINNVLKLSLGFGDVNACIVLKKYNA